MNYRHFLLLCCMAISSFPLTAFAGDLKVTPRVTAGTEYNDNVEEKKGGKSDWVMSVTPGADINYDASRIEFTAKGSVALTDYVNGVKKNSNLGDLDTNLRVEALENFLFFEVGDTYKQVYSDSSRGDLQEGDQSSSEATDRNIFRMSPYIETDLLERTKMKSGYSFERYDYSSSSSDGKIVQTTYFNLDHELTDRWSVDSKLSYANHDSDGDVPTLEIYKLLLGTSYEYAEDSDVFMRVGPAYRIREGGSSTSDPSWEAGIDHSLDKGLVLGFSSSRDYEEDAESNMPRERIKHTLGLTQTLERASWYTKLSYSDYEVSGTDIRTSVWKPLIGGKYDLTERLALTSSLSVDFADAATGYTKRIYGDAGLRYEFSETFAGRFTYRYKDIDRTGIDDDYQVNRFGLFLDASF